MMSSSSVKQYISAQHDFNQKYNTPQSARQNYNKLSRRTYQTDDTAFGTDEQISEENKKKLSKGSKFAIGTGLALTLTVGFDFLFCKGIHVKNLLGKFKCKKTILK